LSGTLPFYADNPDDFLELVLDSSFSFPDSEWADVGEEARDLIKKILVPDPKKRLTVRQILAHPWLAVSGTYHSVPSRARRLAPPSGTLTWAPCVDVMKHDSFVPIVRSSQMAARRPLMHEQP
jgi:serine/threonine protein kinase